MADEKQQPIITVYDPEKEVKEAIKTLQKQQGIIHWAMVAVVLVVAVGFITVVIAAFAIFIDHQDYAAQRYNEYIELLEKREQYLQLETPDQETLDIEINEEVESIQEAPENDTLPDINKTE
ncbi:hypothetical protein HN748_01320 [Candidatus Peregrinibacteria bacterium]|jgi:hypothetical protein|nr:hypothetical protein [Candidatus Peregrinibacteria bacterium]MBT7702851.1 hypothetical protein [Candidatus Peregrinibacteria bacterium]